MQMKASFFVFSSPLTLARGEPTWQRDGLEEDRSVGANGRRIYVHEKCVASKAQACMGMEDV